MDRLSRFFALLTRWGLSLCALVLVLTALYVSLGRQLVPLVAEYRADVETKAHAALGMPLSIGSLEGSWSGFAPILVAHDVTLGSGSSAVRLDHVRACLPSGPVSCRGKCVSRTLKSMACSLASRKTKTATGPSRGYRPATINPST